MPDSYVWTSRSNLSVISLKLFDSSRGVSESWAIEDDSKFTTTRLPACSPFRKASRSGFMR